MKKTLEDFLRDQCNLIDWTPSTEQLNNIEKEINEALKEGKKLSKTECQHIVVKHCGSTRMLVTKGADNSDLNTLLALALSATKEE